MKKITPIILIIVMLTIITASFIGCGDKDTSDLQDQLDELNNKFNELDERVKKLETTISLLDTVGESTQFAELKKQVTALQKDLVSNTASVIKIKSQVTQMQLVLDNISGSGNIDDAVLSEIQSKLNTLYGEVNRVLPFENGKEYEVKLNGVVYYTISVLIEYHDGKVQSEQEIQNCQAMHPVLPVHVPSSNYFDNSRFYNGTIRNKEANGATTLTSLKSGESGRWYFDVDPLLGVDSLPETNFKIIFRLPNNSDINLLVLDNVWGDENGLKPPIVGTKN